MGQRGETRLQGMSGHAHPHRYAKKPTRQSMHQTKGLETNKPHPSYSPSTQAFPTLPWPPDLDLSGVCISSGFGFFFVSHVGLGYHPVLDFFDPSSLASFTEHDFHGL